MPRQVGRGTGGFTLVEFSIVLVLIGLFIGGAFQAYDQYRTRLLLERNANAVAAMKGAIDSYFVVNKHYPCPAPLSAVRGDPQYGRAMDCTDTSTGDYISSTRSIDLDGNGTPENVRIRIGTFPFMDMKDFMADNSIIDRDKPGEADALDAYGRQFTYVVTEAQATPKYADNMGAILVTDEFGRTVSNNGNFLLISHGENGMGARYPDGTTRLACAGLGKDVENCDSDFEFVHGLQSRADGANYNDDQVAFLQWIPYFLWEQTDADDNNVHNINPGNVGIGTKTPTDLMHIVGDATAQDGNVMAYRFWGTDTDGTPGKGKTGTQTLCASDDSDCFPPELIGGDAFPECGAGKIMTGIANGQPVCDDAYSGSVNQSCPPPQYMYSITYSATGKTIGVGCIDPTTYP